MMYKNHPEYDADMNRNANDIEAGCMVVMIVALITFIAVFGLMIIL